MTVTNCKNGDVIARQQAQAEDKEHVLRALDTVVKGIRQKLGESMATIEKPKKLQEATTTSLDALQAMALGFEVEQTQGRLAAIPFLERAIQIDPNFGDAHYVLSLLYGSVNESERAQEASRKRTRWWTG